MTSLSSCYGSDDPKQGLVSMLETSIHHIEQDNFHSVLYLTLGTLYDYVANHPRRLIASELLPYNSVTNTTMTAQQFLREGRPCFDKHAGCTLPSNDQETVICSGWLEKMTTEKHSSQVKWDDDHQALVLLVMDHTDHQPRLRICHEIMIDTGAAQLEVKHEILLVEGQASVQFQNVYGDPRIVVTYTTSSDAVHDDEEEKYEEEQSKVLTFRCDKPASALAWISQVESIMVPSEDSNNLSTSKEPEPTQKTATKTMKQEKFQLASEDSNLNLGIEVEMDGIAGSIVHSGSHLLSKSEETEENDPDDQPFDEPLVRTPTKEKQEAEEKLQEVDGQVLDEQEEHDEIADLELKKSDPINDEPQGDNDSHNKQSEDGENKDEASQQEETPQSPEAEEEMEEISAEPLKKQQEMPPPPPPLPKQQTPKQAQPKQMPKRAPTPEMQRMPKPSPKGQPNSAVHAGTTTAQQSTSSSANVPPKNSPTMVAMTPELRVEQQKKLAEERRRHLVELQRKLARTEQKKKDLESKRKFMETERRKQELIAKAKKPGTAAANASQDTLDQIVKQLASIDAEVKQQHIEVTRIKAEIQQRKQQPLTVGSASAAAPSVEAAKAMQRRHAEQARKEQTLEAQKKAAAEKRRQELEEQRRRAREEQRRKDEARKKRLLEQEQRKQDIIAKAKAVSEKKGAGDAALLKKLSNQMTALDAEVERKRAEEAKVDEQQQEDAEEEDVTDPETARHRIAMRARERQTEEEAKRAPADSVKDQALPSKSSGDSWTSMRYEEAKNKQGEKEHNSTSKGNMNYDPLKHAARRGSNQHQSFEPQSPNLQHQYQFPGGQTPLTPTSQYQQPMGQASHTPNLHQQYQNFQQQHHHQLRQAHSSFPQQHAQSPQQYHQQTYPANHPRNQTPISPTESAGHRPTFSAGSVSTHSAGAQPAQQPPRSGTAHHPPTGSDQKYTKMAEQNNDSDGGDEVEHSELKRRIIVSWALQPPHMQSLKSVNELLSTVQNTFPPSHNLPPHSHFETWQVISDGDLTGPSGLVDEKKLSKAVRKFRFFLHPDKLPNDLTDEQKFLCKLLWDITNDAWEDHKKSKEELDWMN